MFGLEKIKEDIEKLLNYSGDHSNKITYLENVVKGIDVLNQDRERIDSQIKILKDIVVKIEENVSESLKSFESYQIDKYLSSIEKMFEFTKDTVMLAVLAKSDSKLPELKRDLMSPVVEKQRTEQENKDAQSAQQKVKSLGHKILEKKKFLDQEFLRLQREGKPTDNIKGQIDILKLFLEMN